MRILLAIDVQPEFGKKCPEEYDKMLSFLKDHGKDYDLLVASQFINKPDSPYVKYLEWDSMNTINSLDFYADHIVRKTSYGLPNYRFISEDDTLDVIGMDTDACILKVAFDLFDMNANFRILTEYCYSSAGASAHEAAVALMQRQFGSAVV